MRSARTDRCCPWVDANCPGLCGHDSIYTIQGRRWQRSHPASFFSVFSDLCLPFLEISSYRPERFRSLCHPYNFSFSFAKIHFAHVTVGCGRHCFLPQLSGRSEIIRANLLVSFVRSSYGNYRKIHSLLLAIHRPHASSKKTLTGIEVSSGSRSLVILQL